MSLARLAVRNLRRNKVRTTLTIAGASIAIVGFLLLRTVLWAWNVAIEEAAQDRIATRHKVTFVNTLPKTYAEQISQVAGVSASTYANWFGGKNPKNEDEFFATIAVDSPSYFDVYDEMKLPADQLESWQKNPQGAVIGDVLAKSLGVDVGDKVTLIGSIYPGDWPFKIEGIYSPARKTVDRSTFIFHWDYLNDSLPAERQDQIGWIVSRIDDPGAGPAISAAIDKRFDERDTQTVTMSEKEMNLSFMGMMSAVLSAVDIVSFIIIAIMMMLLGNTIAMGVRERTREYGVLRAIGFSPRQIGWYVLGEGVATGLVAGLVGLALGVPLINFGMGRWIEENMGSWFPYFRVDVVSASIALGLAVLLGVIAASLPAWRASRLVVTDALRRVG